MRTSQVLSTSSSTPSRQDAKHGLELAARAGYLAKGVVYGTVGLLTAMTAFGFSGGRIVGTRSAIETLQTQPFGVFILAAIAVGLLGFVLWRGIQAFRDPEQRGSDAKALGQRAGLAISGFTYLTLALFTISLLTGVSLGGSGGGSSSGSGSGSTAEQSTATVMQYSWGVWLVGAVGIALFGVAAYQAYRAYAAPFRKRWRLGTMSATARTWATRISRIGIAARAIAFALIGWFVVQAAVQANPDEARGLDGALRAFADEPWGTAWLAAIGLGFVCYGLYCAINSRYRHIDPLD